MKNKGPRTGLWTVIQDENKPLTQNPPQRSVPTLTTTHQVYSSTFARAEHSMVRRFILYGQVAEAFSSCSLFAFK